MENLYLAHHGVKGMKWGVRRYQNPDGTSKNPNSTKKGLSDRQKRLIKNGAKVAGSVLAVYAGYKLYDRMIPKQIPVTKTVRTQVGRMSVGSFNGFTQYRPVYRDLPKTEMIPNPKRISNKTILHGKRATQNAIKNIVKDANIDQATRLRYDRLTANRKSVDADILRKAGTALKNAPRGPYHR